jgi:iron complex outermembrane receptor protein
MINLKKLPSAIQFALFVGAASLVSGNALAQDDQEEESGEEATTLDRIQVTGSRLTRADVEGALPVITIDREDIDVSGDVSVADVLRDATFASVGNFRPQSGSSAQSLATIDLRALGSGRTLVLIDGRRAPTSPMAASSGADVNAIPLAAVERIEILSDGASAVYGSDAIGGVVNIILRKDFDGAELRYGIGNTKITGGDTEEASAVFGATSERGRILGGAGMSRRGMVFTRDQIGGDELGVSTYGNNYYAWVLNDPRGLYGTIEAAPGFPCDQGAFYFLGNTTANPALSPNGNCSFNFNSVAANEASIENESVFVRGDYQINDDWNVYTSATSSKAESFGRYAPVPGVVVVDDGTPNDINFGVRCDATPGACATDGLPTYYFHRFAAAGNRDNFTDGTNRDFVLGFEGQLNDRVGVDFGIRRTDYKYLELGRGYIVGSLANEAANNGDYDLSDPFGADPDVLNSFKVTINRESRYTSDQVYGSVFFDLFEMGGGISNAVVGAEHREDEFFDNYDSLSEAGVVLGSAGNSSAGDRTASALFFEWLFPFTSTFDMTVAGRYDRYNDYGSDFSPKVSARWQPLDSLTLRASVGQGFRAPPLDILTQKTTFSAEPVNDPQSCASLGLDSDCELQRDTYFVANPDLLSEQSEQYNIGAVWAPTDWLDFSLDHWRIVLEDSIQQVSPQDLINCELDPATYGACPAGLGTTRNPVTGAITRIDAGYANQGEIDTNGWDFAMNTRFDLGAMGNLRNQLQVSYTDEYVETDDAGNQTEFTNLEGFPHGRAALRNAWAVGDWTFNFNTNYIHGQSTVTSSGRGQGGYATHDLQVSWEAPWNATVAVGATNIGDRYPDLNDYDGRPWNFYLYDAYGRTTYFRYTQRF